MVISPSSLNPPTHRRSISVDDYHPAPSSPQQSSSSESDNDENDPATVPIPERPRAKKKKKLRKSNSSISLDSLDRDDLVDDIPVNHTTQPLSSSQAQPSGTHRQQNQQLGTSNQPPQKAVNISPSKKSRAEQPQHQVMKGPARQPPRDTSQQPDSGAPTTATPEMEPDEPLTDDNLVNIAALPTADDFGWDRFIFFSHRAQRYLFPENCYLSQFSPFTSVASSMDGLTTRSVCAVCGAGGNLHDCIRCPLTFHSTCVDPLVTTKPGQNWMCPACKSVKNGDTSPDWFPAPNVPQRPLPDPSTGIDRLIADAREGNPLDMVFSPNLYNYYKSIAGADWLRCSRCHRVRTVTEGVLSEAVRIPFECALAFWADVTERHCDQPGAQKLYGRGELRVMQYLRSRKIQRQLLFRFGFDEVDAVDYGKADMQNLPKLQPLKSAQPQMNLPTVTPMELSPPTPPKALPQQPPGQQSAQLAAQPVWRRPASNVEDGQPKVTPPRQIVPRAAQLVQPVVASAGSTPQHVPGQSPVPVQTPLQALAQAKPNQTMQVSPATLTPAAPPPSAAVPTPSAAVPTPSAAVPPPSAPVTKSEPIENDYNNQDDLLAFIARLEFEESIEDDLTDLALAKDKKLTQLYTAFHATPLKFKRHAIRLVSRMKGETRSQQTQATPLAQTAPPPQVQPLMQPQVQPQLQARSQPQIRPQMQPQASMQLQQLQNQMQAQMQMSQPQTTQQMPVQLTQRQTGVAQRFPQTTVDAMFRQMAIKHVRQMQELEQQFMRTMEQVPASRVAEVMNMKDASVNKLKLKQQQETRAFYQTHGSWVER